MKRQVAEFAANAAADATPATPAGLDTLAPVFPGMKEAATPDPDTTPTPDATPDPAKPNPHDIDVRSKGGSNRYILERAKAGCVSFDNAKQGPYIRAQNGEVVYLRNLVNLTDMGIDRVALEVDKTAQGKRTLASAVEKLKALGVSMEEIRAALGETG